MISKGWVIKKDQKYWSAILTDWDTDILFATIWKCRNIALADLTSISLALKSFRPGEFEGAEIVPVEVKEIE